MKRLIATLALAATILPAHADNVGIASGAPTGTNYQMTANIVQYCSGPDQQINNVISEGGLDNVFRIVGSKDTQYGVVPEDTLVYQQSIDPRMMAKVVMVFPFFTAEVHLVVKDNSPIKTLADLQGKRVVEGPNGSGTWVTVQVLKQATGMTWQPMSLSQADGFNAVMTGQADAEFIVAGAPVKMLQEKTGYRLIPISHPAIGKLGYYTSTMIPSGTYGAVKNTVQTYYVDNVLATFDYKAQYQESISKLVTCISRNLGNLQKNGHPKWRGVDPVNDIERIKWRIHPAAKAAINRELKRGAGK